MTRQHVPHRMSLPPPEAISVVSTIVLTVIAIALAGVVVTWAPRSVLLSTAVVLSGALVVSGILAALARVRTAPSRTRGAPPGSAVRHGTLPPGSDVPGGTVRPDEPPATERERVWLTLGLSSMALLALALVVPEDVGAVLAAVAFAGVVVFRASVGWTFRVHRARAPTTRSAPNVAMHEEREDA